VNAATPGRPRQVIVIGSGIAGTAAALAARSANAAVTLIDGGPGASVLWTGAIDALDWQESAPIVALAGGDRRVLGALEVLSVGDGPCRLLTTAGLVRPARGCDASLLDVAHCGGGPVGVVACDRPGWHARSLAHAWGQPFAALDVAIIRFADESILPDVDFAARHDDSERLGWLGNRLREALSRIPSQWAALVLPPLLGVDRPRAQALSRQVGIACGEALASPGGPPGARFEMARNRALPAMEVQVVQGRATSVSRGAQDWSVTLYGGQTLSAAAVVLATGGILGGGLEYAPSETRLATALPFAACAPLRSTFEAPIQIGMDGQRIDPPGSLFGYPPERFAGAFGRSSPFDRAGILVDASGHVLGPTGPLAGLFAAGDAAADTPRSWLGALASGVRAGTVAASC